MFWTYTAKQNADDNGDHQDTNCKHGYLVMDVIFLILRVISVFIRAVLPIVVPFMGTIAMLKDACLRNMEAYI